MWDELTQFKLLAAVLATLCLVLGLTALLLLSRPTDEEADAAAEKASRDGYGNGYADGKRFGVNSSHATWAGYADTGEPLKHDGAEYFVSTRKAKE